MVVARNSSGRMDSAAKRTAFIDTVINRDETYWANRVVLKIDIPFNEHSYIIGRDGVNTKRVIKNTECYVHFPDSNRFAQADKSNIVSLTGSFCNIEKARKAIRDLAPIMITIQLPKQFVDNFDFATAVEWMTQKARDANVPMTICTDRFSGQQFVTVRTSAAKVDTARQALLLVREYFGAEEEPTCFTSLEILKPAWSKVLGERNANVQRICDWTGATIFYPRKDLSASTFFICGHMENLLLARQCILAFQPMSFVFNCARLDNSHADLYNLRNQLNLSVEVKYDQENLQHTVYVTGHEYQATDMYAVRKFFLPDSDVTVVSEEYDKIYQAMAMENLKPVPVSPIFGNPIYVAVTPGLQLPVEFSYCTPGCYQFSPTYCYPITPEITSSNYTTASSSSYKEATPQMAQGEMSSQREQVEEYSGSRIKAKRAQKSAITVHPRHVTKKWCGQGFSQSMLDLSSKSPAKESPLRSLPTTPCHKNLSAQTDSIEELMEKLRLGKYTDMFLRAKIDTKELLEMNEMDMKRLGVDCVGRNRLTAVKNELRTKRRLF